MRGKLIVFEGIECSGKTTQSLRLICHLQDVFLKSLRDQGKITGITRTKEPGDTEPGQEIRKMLLDPSSDLDPYAELFLYFADRAQHVARVIRPALNRGYIVLCDRFSASTFAYQGYGRELDLDFIERTNHYAADGITPDLTVYLDLDPEIAIERMRKRGQIDRIEREGIEFHRRVKEGFDRVMDCDRTVRVDATLDEDEIAAFIQQEVGRYLREWYDL
jgi:dTMP kinase